MSDEIGPKIRASDPFQSDEKERADLSGRSGRGHLVGCPPISPNPISPNGLGLEG